MGDVIESAEHAGPDHNDAMDLQDPRALWLARWQRWTEIPLVVLAVLMIPLLVVPAFVELPAGWAGTFVVVDILIWGAFAIDFVVRFGLSRAKRTFLRHNWVDLLIVLVSFLRTVSILRAARALRLLRLTRLVGFAGYAGQTSRRLLSRHGLRWVLGAGVGLILIASLVVWEAERGVRGSRIDNFGDAVWWATTTATTVNYGDAYPSTTVGKVFALVMMFVGVTIFTMVTASLSAMFVSSEARQHEEPVTREELNRKLDEILARLDALDRREGAIAGAAPDR